MSLFSDEFKRRVNDYFPSLGNRPPGLGSGGLLGLIESMFSSTDNGKGASQVGVEDAGGYTTESDVEGHLQEIDPGAWFVSGSPVTATGSSQNVAHGLGRTPRLVFPILVSGHDGSGGAGTQFPDWSPGAHDATNAKFTMVAGATFIVIAV